MEFETLYITHSVCRESLAATSERTLIFELGHLKELEITDDKEILRWKTGQKIVSFCHYQERYTTNEFGTTKSEFS